MIPTVQLQLRKNGSSSSSSSIGSGSSDGAASEDTASSCSGNGGSSRKRRKIEVIRPVAAPVQEPTLEIPEVSEADVGKMVLSETSGGTLTGVVEKFSEGHDGLGVWSIR